MKVLVTGGAGFVGTNLIKQLLKEGHQVISVDNYHTGLKSNHQSGAQYIEFDIRNVDDYSSWGEFDVVYHLAAIARIQPSFKEPYDYFTTNANATFKVAKYCSEKNIPLVFAGSSSHWSGTHYGLKASIARFYNVYGPYHLKEGGYCTVIGKWEKAYEEGKSLTIYGTGEKRRDFTHIDDIVGALILINEKQAWGHVFELGRGKNYSINEIASLYKTNIVYKNNKPGEAEITLCTDTLAKEILDWEAKLDISDYINNYLNNK